MSAARSGWTRVDAGIYRRGASYLVDFLANGKRYHLRIGSVSLTIARKIVAELRGDIARKVAGLSPAPAPISVKEILEARIEERQLKVADSSLRRMMEHSVHLEGILGKVDARILEPKDIRRYQRRRLDEKARSATVNRETTFLHSAIRLAVREGKLERDVLDGIEKLPEPEPGSCARVLSTDEIRRIQTHAIPWFRRFIEVAVSIGCRANELASVCLNDVDEDCATITFRSETVKGRRGRRRNRTIPLPPDAAAAVREQMNESKLRGSRYLFFARRDTSQPCARCEATGAWRAASARARIKSRLHDLRHTFISRLIASGIDAAIVRRIVGHTTTQMIDVRYAHLDISALKTALGTEKIEKDSHGIPTRVRP